MVCTNRTGPRTHMGSAVLAVTGCVTVVVLAAGCSSSSKGGSSPAAVTPAASGSAASPTTTPASATAPAALTVTGTPTAGPGVPGSQVAWNGKLLYYFSGDHAVGDSNGDSVGGVWHVVALTASSAPTTTVVIGGY